MAEPLVILPTSQGYSDLQVDAVNALTSFKGISPIADAMMGAVEVGIEAAMGAGEVDPVEAGLKVAFQMIQVAAGAIGATGIGAVIGIVAGILSMPAAKSTDQTMESLQAYCNGYDVRPYGTGADYGDGPSVLGCDYFLSPYPSPGTWSPSPSFKGPWRSPFAQTCWSIFETRLWSKSTYLQQPTKLAAHDLETRRAFRNARRAISAAYLRGGSDGGNALWLIYADMVTKALWPSDGSKPAIDLDEVEALYVADGVTASPAEQDPEFGLVGFKGLKNPNADLCQYLQHTAALQVLKNGWGAQDQTVRDGVEECGHLGTFSCPVYTRAPLDALYELARRWGNTINPIYAQDAAFKAHLEKVVKEHTGRPLPKKKRPIVRPRPPGSNVPYLLAGGAAAGGLGYAVATGAAAIWDRSARRFLARSF